MKNNPLQITSVEGATQKQPPVQTKMARRQEIQATMERLWLQDPAQFDPMRDCVQRKRMAKTLDILKEKSLDSKLVADLGCGSGYLSRAVRDAGAIVHSVDVAGNALALLKAQDMHHITPFQDALPMTRLDDGVYDIVICTEVIGYLKPIEYRLTFSELARIVKAKGFVVCSSSIDVDSDNALERFAALAETEFEIDRWVLSYDLLWLKLCRFFDAPTLYVQASKKKELRMKEIAKRKGLGRIIFQCNSSFALGCFWSVIAFATNPLASFCRQSEGLMNLLEKISQFFWSESGVTHALFLGNRRQMIFPLAENEIPKEMKHKRQVWE
ncbi:MAG: class I SAM-dependent methyltransferase [Parachlamydiaceae bacterium]